MRLSFYAFPSLFFPYSSYGAIFYAYSLFSSFNSTGSIH
jgi:hypothetical protein